MPHRPKRRSAAQITPTLLTGLEHGRGARGEAGAGRERHGRRGRRYPHPRHRPDGGRREPCHHGSRRRRLGKRQQITLSTATMRMPRLPWPRSVAETPAAATNAAAAASPAAETAPAAALVDLLQKPVAAAPVAAPSRRPRSLKPLRRYRATPATPAPVAAAAPATPVRQQRLLRSRTPPGYGNAAAPVAAGSCPAGP